MSSQIAIFIDAENLTSWIKNGGVESLMEELLPLGQIVVRKAYGKWSTTQLAPLQSVLNDNGFELVHTFHPVSGKNSTDIKMTVDTMEVAIESRAQWIVLATGDSDFSPLFRKLREQGKDVIGVGPKSPLSECVKNSCSRYIYTDNAEEQSDETERNNMLVSEKIDFIEILRSVLQGEDGPIHLSVLMQKMLERDNAFSVKRLGFKTFKEFVSSVDFAEVKDDGNGTIMVSLSKKKVAVQEDAQMVLAKVLKKKGWDVFSKGILRKIYRLACDKTSQKPKSKQDLVQEIAFKNLAGTTSGIINRALGLFFKAKLVTVSTSESEKQWTLENTNLYWQKIDKALLNRLSDGLRESGISAKVSDVKSLLYGKYSDEDLESLFAQYRDVIS